MLITGSLMFSRFNTVPTCNRQTDVHTGTQQRPC